MNTSGTNHQSSRLMVGLAFAAIYIIWGSTYLAIRVVVESMPAFFSAGIRFVIAGALLSAFLWLKGVALPTRAQWRHSFVSGTLLLMGGNGLVVFAERSLSSGRAALLVALAPVWFALLEWLRPGGKRPEPKTVAGIFVGLLGVFALVSGRGSGSENSLSGALAVLCAGISWAGGFALQQAPSCRRFALDERGRANALRRSDAADCRNSSGRTLPYELVGDHAAIHCRPGLPRGLRFVDWVQRVRLALESDHPRPKSLPTLT